MDDNPEIVTGGCMCGAVRYEAIGEPLDVGYCHCHSCRRHTGAPVVTFVMFEADQVRFTGRERSIYNSSPGVGRAFVPDRHWFHEERIAWFDVADGLPRYRGVGMKDEEPYRHGPATEGS